MTNEIEDQQKPRDLLTSEQISQLKSQGVVAHPKEVSSPQTMRIDLHCHTEASPDCSTPIEEIPDRCFERGIQVLAITDHDCLWGAQRLQEAVSRLEAPDLNVIVGEEITTSQGELVGLFLEQKVESGLTPRETVQAIKSQGGLVLLPHGFDPLRLPRLKSTAREALVDAIDIIETFNARVSRPYWNRRAAEWAQIHGFLESAGSDAHTLADIGSAWVEVPRRAVKTPQDLLAALEGGVPVGKWTHPLMAYLYKLWYRIHLSVKNMFS